MPVGPFTRVFEGRSSESFHCLLNPEHDGRIADLFFVFRQSYFPPLHEESSFVSAVSLRSPLFSVYHLLPPLSTHGIYVYTYVSAGVRVLFLRSLDLLIRLVHHLLLLGVFFSTSRCLSRVSLLDFVCSCSSSFMCEILSIFLFFSHRQPDTSSAVLFFRLFYLLLLLFYVLTPERQSFQQALLAHPLIKARDEPPPSSESEEKSGENDASSPSTVPEGDSNSHRPAQGQSEERRGEADGTQQQSSSSSSTATTNGAVSGSSGAEAAQAGGGVVPADEKKEQAQTEETADEKKV